jgi:hypothetical protein
LQHNNLTLENVYVRPMSPVLRNQLTKRIKFKDRMTYLVTIANFEHATKVVAYVAHPAIPPNIAKMQVGKKHHEDISVDFAQVLEEYAKKLHASQDMKMTVTQLKARTKAKALNDFIQHAETKLRQFFQKKT